MTGLGQANFWESLRRLFTPAISGRDTGRTPHAGRAALLCLLAALVIWFLLTMGEVHTADIDFRVELLNPPEGQALVEPLPEFVEGEVEGPGFQLLKLFFTPPTISLDADSQRVDLMEENVELTGGVRMRSIRPRTLSLVTDDLIERRIPIAVRATFETAPGYSFTPSDSVVYTPDSVTVRGAARVVNRLRAWPTERATFTGLLDSMQVTLDLADTLGGFIVPDVESVSVMVAVAGFTEVEQEVSVNVRGAPTAAAESQETIERTRAREQSVRLTPTMVRVRYNVVLPQYYEASTTDAVQAYVNFDDIRTSNSNRLLVRVVFPEHFVVRDVTVTPQTVGYIIVQASR